MHDGITSAMAQYDDKEGAEKETTRRTAQKQQGSRHAEAGPSRRETGPRALKRREATGDTAVSRLEEDGEGIRTRNKTKKLREGIG